MFCLFSWSLLFQYNISCPKELFDFFDFSFLLLLLYTSSSSIIAFFFFFHRSFPCTSYLLWLKVTLQLLLSFYSFYLLFLLLHCTKISHPYTSQHIASAKWHRRHIIETSLTLFHRASLLLSFWTYAFKIIVYPINQLSTPILKNKSSFWCLLHIKPNYLKLWIFGGLCYLWLWLYNKHKLEYFFRLFKHP